MSEIKEKILNNKFASSLLILFFLTLPFERILTFELAGFTVKPPYIAGLLLIIYFLYRVASKNIKVRLRSYDYAAIAFIVFSYATFFWSIDRMKTLIISSMFLFVYLIFLSVRSCLEPKKIELYSKFFIWLGVVCSVFALFQFFGDSVGVSQHITGLSDLYTKSVFGFPRVQSTFFEPGFFANFLLIAIFMNMGRIGSKSSYYFSFVIIFVAFILTLSRGGFLAFAIAYALAVILIILKKRDKTMIIYRSLALMLISIVLALFSIWLVSGSQGITSFSGQTKNTEDLTVGTSQENVQNFTRNATIKIAIENWKKNIFGIGTGAFGALPEFDKTREMGNQRQTVNSLYPEVLVEVGVQGLMAFIVFIVLFLYEVLKRKRDVQSIIFGVAIIAIFIQYLSFSTLYLIYVWVFLGLAAASLSEKDQ